MNYIYLTINKLINHIVAIVNPMLIVTHDTIFNPILCNDAYFPIFKYFLSKYAKNKFIIKFNEDSLALTTPA